MRLTVIPRMATMASLDGWCNAPSSDRLRWFDPPYECLTCARVPYNQSVTLPAGVSTETVTVPIISFHAHPNIVDEDLELRPGFHVPLVTVDLEVVCVRLAARVFHVLA